MGFRPISQLRLTEVQCQTERLEITHFATCLLTTGRVSFPKMYFKSFGAPASIQNSIKSAIASRHFFGIIGRIGKIESPKWILFVENWRHSARRYKDYDKHHTSNWFYFAKRF